MIARTKRWMTRQLLLGEFSSRRQVVRRSAIMAVRIAFLAYAMNVGLHFILYFAGLMPYALGPALVLATVLTPGVSFVVAFVAYYVVGLAVYELTISRSEFERISRIDSLSGLLNRRAFMDSYATSVNPAALVLFDVDRFKAVNDRHGHGAGDEVIVAVATVLADVFGPDHVVARFGGEEYAVLVRGLTTAECMALVEKALKAIEDRAIELEAEQIHVTVSAGIASFVAQRHFRELFTAADKALYVAKASGRNRAVHADDIAKLSIGRATGGQLAG
jgi:diguanylate cyclase (GGDEF)-like protein